MSVPSRSVRGRLGALVLHSRVGGREITQNARSVFLSRFEREVVEAAEAKGEQLTPAELARRTEFARKAYFARLALKSAKVRRERAAARGDP